MSGICRDSDYPTINGSCEPNKCKPYTTVSIFYIFEDMNVKSFFDISEWQFNKINRLKERDEDAMLAAIQESTLWAEFNAAGQGFQDYTTGM